MYGNTVESQFRYFFEEQQDVLGLTFDAKRSKNGIWALSKTTLDGNWDICYLQEHSRALAVGDMDTRILIVPRGAAIQHRKNVNVYASLWFDYLIRGFRNYQLFTNIEDMILGLKCCEKLLILLLPRLEAALTTSSN